MSLLPYLLGALAVVGAATAAYQFVDNRWATDAGIEEGRKREKADLQPKITACQASLKASEDAVAAQNRAVEALAAESKARQQKAARALQDASRAAVGAIKEADRLRVLAKGGNAAGGSTACPAGSAVEEVRRGLKGG